MYQRRGFTLIEILVVVAIIGVLAALLIPTLTMLQDRQKRGATTEQIDQIGYALAEYLKTSPVFGDDIDGDGVPDRQGVPYDPLPDGSYIIPDVWTYIGARYVKDGEPPLVEIKSQNLRTSGRESAGLRDGEIILDSWDQPIVVRLTNETAKREREDGEEGDEIPGRTYTSVIELWSAGGSIINIGSRQQIIDSTEDDMVYRYRIGVDEGFRWVDKKVFTNEWLRQGDHDPIE